jgi:hypothetical protein
MSKAGPLSALPSQIKRGDRAETGKFLAMLFLSQKYSVKKINAKHLDVDPCWELLQGVVIPISAGNTGGSGC